MLPTSLPPFDERLRFHAQCLRLASLPPLKSKDTSHIDELVTFPLPSRELRDLVQYMYPKVKYLTPTLRVTFHVTSFYGQHPKVIMKFWETDRGVVEPPVPIKERMRFYASKMDIRTDCYTERNDFFGEVARDHYVMWRVKLVRGDDFDLFQVCLHKYIEGMAQQCCNALDEDE